LCVSAVSGSACRDRGRRCDRGRRWRAAPRVARTRASSRQGRRRCRPKPTRTPARRDEISCAHPGARFRLKVHGRPLRFPRIAKTLRRPPQSRAPDQRTRSSPGPEFGPDDLWTVGGRGSGAGLTGTAIGQRKWPHVVWRALAPNKPAPVYSRYGPRAAPSSTGRGARQAPPGGGCVPQAGSRVQRPRASHWLSLAWRAAARAPRATSCL